MPELPEGVDMELQSQPSKAVVHLEDALIIISLVLLWLPIVGLRGLWVNVVLGLCLLTMVLILVRRKRRVDKLFAELRKRQAMIEAMGGYPTIPGMMPNRMGAERPTTEVDDLP
jgi:hypothetical protein